MTYKKLKVNYDTPLTEQFKELGIKNYLNLSTIESLYPPPKDDTIYDVEDGTEWMGISPRENREKFAKSGRRGLTIHEGLALIRKNPKILDHHFIDLCGSRCYEDGVPFVYRFGGKPALDNDFEGHAFPKWGAASCGSGSSEIGDLDLEARVRDLEEFRAKVEKVLNLT